jgi:hypothetical protein
MPYQTIERNEMSVRSIFVDTQFDIQVDGRESHVVALKRCGCTGALAGTVERMSVKEVASARRRGKSIPEQPEGADALWVGWAAMYGRTVVYAWGPEACAQALIRWWGVRNVRGRVKRSETKRIEYAAHKRENLQRLMKAAA